MVLRTSSKRDRKIGVKGGAVKTRGYGRKQLQVKKTHKRERESYIERVKGKTHKEEEREKERGNWGRDTKQRKS